MRALSLSTNWFKAGALSAREMVDVALSLGFTELELGYNTTIDQAKGFRAIMQGAGCGVRVGSVHAFCPVPISAPCGYPELYSLASFSKEARAMARLQIVRNIEFTAQMGADTLVLHAGRVTFNSLFRFIDSTILRKNRGLNPKALAIRAKRGRKMMPIFRKELEALVPTLEACRVTLGIENMPYLEGFPSEGEWEGILAPTAVGGGPLQVGGGPLGKWIKPWFDTGHNRVREQMGWVKPFQETDFAKFDFAGMHLNDVEDVYDNHFAPGKGKVDFAALKDMMLKVPHVVFEPNTSVTREELAEGVTLIKGILA